MWRVHSLVASPSRPAQSRARPVMSTLPSLPMATLLPNSSYFISRTAGMSAGCCSSRKRPVESRRCVSLERANGPCTSTYSLHPIEPEIVAAAEELSVLEEVTVRVATRAHLIAMKVLARDDRHRPQDFDDLRALLAGASEDELSTVREALALVESRGFNRGRSVGEDFTRAIADTSR